MAEVTHSRLYNVVLRRLGLKTIQGLKVSDVVQPVAIVDDLTDLTRPLVGATFGGQAPRGPIAALRSAAELFTGPSAGWLLWWDDSASNFNRLVIGRVSLLTANIVAGSFHIAAGDEAQSLLGPRWTLNGGTIAGAAPAGVANRSNTVWQVVTFLPPGTFVTVINGAVNDDQNVGFIWVELPDL